MFENEAYSFQKHATSAQVNGYYEVQFSLSSIIIKATDNEPRKTETSKMDRNLPITTDKRDLFYPVEVNRCFLRGPLR